MGTFGRRRLVISLPCSWPSQLPGVERASRPSTWAADCSWSCRCEGQRGASVAARPLRRWQSACCRFRAGRTVTAWRRSIWAAASGSASGSRGPHWCWGGYSVEVVDVAGTVVVHIPTLVQSGQFGPENRRTARDRQLLCPVVNADPEAHLKFLYSAMIMCNDEAGTSLLSRLYR
jgi:hypothetical protein